MPVQKAIDIARLYLSEKYTTDEVILNNPDKEVVDVVNKLNSGTHKVVSTMRKYGLQERKLRSWF